MFTNKHTEVLCKKKSNSHLVYSIGFKLLLLLESCARTSRQNALTRNKVNYLTELSSPQRYDLPTDYGRPSMLIPSLTRQLSTRGNRYWKRSLCSARDIAPSPPIKPERSVASHECLLQGHRSTQPRLFSFCFGGPSRGCLTKRRIPCLTLLLKLRITWVPGRTAISCSNFNRTPPTTTTLQFRPMYLMRHQPACHNATHAQRGT